MSSRRHDYDYATVRIVPCLPREAFVTVGVILHARTADFLEARLQTDRDWIASNCPDLDADLVIRYLNAVDQITKGGPEAGDIGMLTPSARFHWLTSPKSSAVQTSGVHTGRSANPAEALDELFERHVLPRAGIESPHIPNPPKQ